MGSKMSELPRAQLHYLGDRFGYRASIIKGGPAYTATKKTPSAALQVLATMAGPYELVLCDSVTAGIDPVGISPVRIDVNVSDREALQILAAASAASILAGGRRDNE